MVYQHFLTPPLILSVSLTLVWFVLLLRKRNSCINHWRIDRQLDGQVFYAILEAGSDNSIIYLLSKCTELGTRQATWLCAPRLRRLSTAQVSYVDKKKSFIYSIYSSDIFIFFHPVCVLEAKVSFRKKFYSVVLKVY